jgi:hypothetical protein
MIRDAVRQQALGEFLRKHRELSTKPVDDKKLLRWPGSVPRGMPGSNREKW